MLSTLKETVANNATGKEVIATVESIIKKTSALWNKSKYFRIISIVSGAFVMSYFANRIYLKLYRKYYNMPPGLYGIPLLGQALSLMDPWALTRLGPNQPAISITFGPTLHVITINDPYLIKKVYADPRTTANPPSWNPDADAFVFKNGKDWSKRRKIISANLMSTMKAKFVENSTKKFIKNKVFTVFDEQIEKNEKIGVKKLLRPLGFNIILQACFGQELKTLDDPFWLKYDAVIREMGKNAEMQDLVHAVCGGDNRLSTFVLNTVFGMRTIGEIWNELRDLAEGFAMDKENDIEQENKSSDIKLFSDYIEEYTASSNGKYDKTQLFGDMGTMFLAATDTVLFISLLA